ncbi:hypothetical protein C1645_836860 [Glomus cerebriforme]|uniref:Uncharacterized protein n=1 Tax=Glomus cerebriforme TaxID=658196 RepID=A0A397S9M8_9GLOM|nr:hypothetical protein C1645_836860 [Glomus cerebriforme]
MEGADIEATIKNICETSVIVAIPNVSGIDPKRLTKEQLLFELTKRNINIINTAKRDELVRELELVLANEIEIMQKVWKLLEGYFLKGDIDKSKRFTTTTMLENLKRKVKEGELEEDKISKLLTIQGWISHYSAQHHQKMAKMSVDILERVSDS